MSQVCVIARREWRDTMRDGRAWWTVLLVMALLVLAVGLGVSQLHRVRAERDAAMAVERRVWVTQAPKHPHSAAHHGFYLFQPVSILAAFDPGLLDYVGHVRHLEPHGERLARFTPAEDRPALRQFPLLSGAATLQIVVPLLLVALLQGTFAQERESGTLRLLVSLGVRPSVLGVGKLVGSMVPLLTILAVAAVVTWAVVLLGVNPDARWDALGRAAASGLAYGAWITLFAVAVLALSAGVRTSRQALLASLSLWFVVAVFGPQLAVEVAARVHPAPTPQRFLAALGEAQKRRPSYWEDLVPAATTRLLARYGVSRVEDLPVSPAAVALLDQEDDDTARIGREFDQLHRIHEAQDRVVSRFAWLFPLITVQQLSMAAAGTDAWHARDFAGQAEQYRRRAVRMLNEDAARNDREDVVRTGVRYEADERLWAHVPPFVYRPPTAGEVVQRETSTVWALLVWLSLVTTTCVAVLRRLSPA